MLSAGQAWAYSGDTIQDDIAREFAGGPSSYTIPLTPPSQPSPGPSTPSCNTLLQQEMAAGEIPADEACYCPVGATQPVCSTYPGGDCPSLLQDTEARLGSNAQYYDCTCASSSATPSCTSYYKLCEANLPNYQNSTNECTCSQNATSAIPTCTSDYSICENNARQYKNSNTYCSCSQTSTNPTCCTTTTTQDCSTTKKCTSTQGPEKDCWLDYGDKGSGQQWYGWKVWQFNNGTFNVLTCATSPSDVSNPRPLNGKLYNCHPPIYVFPGTCDFNTVSKTCNPVTTCTPVTTKSCTTEP